MPAYRVAIFIGAFLSFQVEMVLGKFILPWFGGEAAIWTACMLFFQTALLVGYAYAHLLRKLPERQQADLHILLLLCSTLLLGLHLLIWGSPLLPSALWKPHGDDSPALAILRLLAVSCGLPFVLLTSTAPLLQAWLTQIRDDHSVFRLYSLSNAGSLLGLLSYPFVFEPLLGIRQQAALWAVLYLAFVAGSVVCAWHARRATAARAEPAAAAATRPSLGRYLIWCALAACASILLLATTNEICQDLSVFPLLWVLPLAVYLLSFIICFDSRSWYRRSMFATLLVATMLSTVFVLQPGTYMSAPRELAVHIGNLFICCMICHGELVRLLPAPRYLTPFYLTVAAGGMVGGVFVNIVSPFIFQEYTELQLGLWLTAVLLLICMAADGTSWLYEVRRRFWVPCIGLAAALPILLLRSTGGTTAERVVHIVNYSVAMTLGMLLVGALLLGLSRWNQWGLGKQRRTWTSVIGAVALVVSFGVNLAGTLPTWDNLVTRTRGFHGVVRVFDQGPLRVLMHGMTYHGWQLRDPDKARTPICYFGRQTAIGALFETRPKGHRLRIGVIGMGAGTLASYAQKGDLLRFFEINPQVQTLSDKGYFTFLKDCPAQVDVVLGDGRISLERETGEERYDVLVLDAFSSDAIPLHLLTREAFALYQSRLKSDGVMAAHISNRHLQLSPIICRLAGELGMQSAVAEVPVLRGNTWVPCQPDVYNEISRWVIVTSNTALLQQPPLADAIRVTADNLPLGPLWTDDHSNLLQALRY